VLLLAAFVAFFFRNPRREVPQDPGVIVSPADGRVVKIERVGNVTKLSIFLSIFNVHVNRSPIAGRIEAIEYKKGKFKLAFDHAASVENERNVIMVAQGDLKIVFTQIAGLIARRIVCDLREGDTVRAGQRFGIIRFGSRADLYLPEAVRPLVAVGQTMVGGETVIAEWPA